MVEGKGGGQEDGRKDDGWMDRCMHGWGQEEGGVVDEGNFL